MFHVFIHTVKLISDKSQKLTTLYSFGSAKLMERTRLKLPQTRLLRRFGIISDKSQNCQHSRVLDRLS